MHKQLYKFFCIASKCQMLWIVNQVLNCGFSPILGSIVLSKYTVADNMITGITQPRSFVVNTAAIVERHNAAIYLHSRPQR